MQICGEINLEVEGEKKLLNKVLPMLAVIFEIQFSILDYYSYPVPESYLPGIALMLYFKVILTVALSGYVIRLF